jgi:hypothetical protein
MEIPKQYIKRGRKRKEEKKFKDKKGEFEKRQKGREEG